MEHLKSYIGQDLSTLTFEYLINDEDYTPFRYEDIVLLSKKITKWDNLLFWAGRTGKLDIIKYIDPFIKDKDDWFCCMGEAAENSHPLIFFYIVNKFDYIKCYVMTCAGKGGYPEIIKYIRNHYSNADKYLIKGAVQGNNLELFIECMYVLENDVKQWQTEILSPIVNSGSISILEYIGDNIDGVDWTYVMRNSTWEGNFDMFKYSLIKGADLSKISSSGMGSGGNIEMVKYVENIQSIDWNELMEHAATSNHENLMSYAIAKGANNLTECMIKASERGHLSIILSLERIIRDKGIHISTAIWDKCMISAAENAVSYNCLNVMEIIKYCGDKGAYNWNECMKEGAHHLCLDMVKYAESKGADVWEESIDYMKRCNLYLMNDNNDTDYKRNKRAIISSIEEHFKYKLRMYKRRKLT